MYPTTKTRGVNRVFEIIEKCAHDLQFDYFPIQLDSADLEVNTDGGGERRRPCVVTKAKDET